jgi:two-component system chemotaxis sensor kinase CheA
MANNDKYNMQSAMSLYFTESREMLDTMESCLLDIEKDNKDQETINALFRSAHTIKGSSGMFGFSEIEKFTHNVENILDDVRHGKIEIDSNLSSIFLEARDYIMALLDFFENDNAAVLNKELSAEKEKLLEKFKPYLPESAKEVLPKSKLWHISLQFKTNSFRNGFDPRTFIAYLETLGKIINTTAVKNKVPVLSKIDPESCYLGFEIDFDGDTTKKKIEEVFEFVKEDCDIHIISPLDAINNSIKLINELPETTVRIGEILTNTGIITDTELDKALTKQKKDILKDEKNNTDTASKIGEIFVEEKMVHKPVLDAAIEKQKDIVKSEERKNKSIRIDADKLDDLINVVGELVITGANIRQLAERNADSDILQSSITMSRLIEDVRDKTMNIRMVQIGETFKRFERVVHDLSKETGKEIDLVISGGDAELDKTLIERISDPLMHLIRNSVDHGITTPAERTAKGKPRRGKIYLNAFHETGSIVIEVKDDGDGLKRDKIFDKALKLGMVQSGQNISDAELFQLIFEPGFSTADKITNISGRGVGMDVVKRNIEALRGTTLLESKEGEGMTIRIHLPLTLAIIDGFMIMVNDYYYVIPLDMVVEGTEVTKEEISGRDGGNFMNLRGEMLPLLRLRNFFEFDDGGQISENVIVVEYSRKKIGLVADKLMGEFQTVIKPLGKFFTDLQWISGATILGNGEVAVILDIPKLIQAV